MSEEKPLWQWETDPSVLNKRCTYCDKSMVFDRSTAVKYRDKVYHNYCLLTFLTNFHNTHSPAEVASIYNPYGGMFP